MTEQEKLRELLQQADISEYDIEVLFTLFATDDAVRGAYEALVELGDDAALIQKAVEKLIDRKSPIFTDCEDIVITVLARMEELGCPLKVAEYLPKIIGIGSEVGRWIRSETLKLRCGQGMLISVDEQKESEADMLYTAAFIGIYAAAEHLAGRYDTQFYRELIKEHSIADVNISVCEKLGYATDSDEEQALDALIREALKCVLYYDLGTDEQSEAMMLAMFSFGIILWLNKNGKPDGRCLNERILAGTLRQNYPTAAVMGVVPDEESDSVEFTLCFDSVEESAQFRREIDNYSNIALHPGGEQKAGPAFVRCRMYRVG